MRISDWSSDVCSSDLVNPPLPARGRPTGSFVLAPSPAKAGEGRGGVAWAPTTFGRKRPSRDHPPASPCLRSGRSQRQEQRHGLLQLLTSEERRVGEEVVGTCRLRVSPAK